MDEPSVLRTTKIGNGFVKEDVLNYLEELNEKMQELQNDLDNAKGKNVQSDPQEIAKYRNQVDNLQEKLNASNNALRATRKENEDLKKQIEILKAGGSVPSTGGANANNQALEAAKREIDTLKTQLANAQKANTGNANGVTPQAQQALEAAKKEIDSLRAKLQTAEANTNKANPAADAELAKTKQELTKANADLKSKTDELAKKTTELTAKTKEVADKDNQIKKLTDEVANVTKTVEEREKEITNLNKQVEEAKDAANNPALMMNALFVEANKTVTKLKEQAQEEADNKIKEANEKAEQIIKEADEKAEKTVSDADNKAKNTIDEANNEAEKVNIMTSKVRDTLLSEIESVNTKFADLTNSLTKLTGQASEHMINAQKVIDNAKKAVNDTDVESIKTADSSKFNAKVNDNAKKEEPKKAEPKKEEPVKNDDPFANVANSGYNAGNLKKEDKPVINNTPKQTAPVKEPEKQPEPQKPAPKKASFNFDMSELLKAAEEEAAKNQEG